MLLEFKRIFLLSFPLLFNVVEVIEIYQENSEANYVTFSLGHIQPSRKYVFVCEI
jgi:hypothetical protein